MILLLDMTDKAMICTKAPEPKTDQHGEQRVERSTNQPLWATEVVVTDSSGGEVIRITTSGDKPDIAVHDEVISSGLTALPWSTNGRNGMAYRATSLRALTD